MRTALVFLIATLATGCTLKNAQAPGAPLGFADAEYQLVGEVSEEVCNTYILGIDFSGLFMKTSGNVPGGPGIGILPIGGPAKEVSEAMFVAQEGMGDATHIINPRTASNAKGLLIFGHPIFGKRCGSVAGPTAKVMGPYQYAR